MLRRLAARALPVLLLSSLFTPLPQSPAAADTISTIPLTSFTDMAVDLGHHHVFLGNGSKLDVRSDLGAEVSTMALNVQDLEVSPDGTRLVVGTSGGIRVYDTSSLALLGTYEPGGSCVTAVGTVGSKVWFGCGALYVVDLAAASPTATQVLAPGSISRVAISPADPNRVLIAFMDSSMTYDKLQLLDTSTDPVTVLATQTVTDGSSRFAFSSDGSAVIGCRFSGSGAHSRWSATDLTSLPAYGTDVAGAQALTVSGTGYWAGGRDSATASYADARVYDPSGALVRSFDFGSTLGRLAPNGLALTSNASRLYAVTYDGNGHYELRVLGSPTKRVPALSLTAPTGAVIGVSYAVKGRLTSSGPALSGKTLTVKRMSSYGTVTKPSVKTASDGTFTITDKVSARGWYTYSVAWAGDADHTSVTRSIKAYVKGKAVTVSVAVSTTRVTYGAAYVTVTAHLSTATQSRSLSIYATPVGGAATRLKTATVNSSGNVSGSWRPSQNTYYSARFLGDAVYEPATASRLVLVSPRLTYKVSYSYAKSGSTYLFHDSTPPLILVHLEPVRGGCMAATEQKWVSGAWKTVSVSSCLGISSDPDLKSGNCGISMDDYPRSGTFRVRITFPATKYFASSALPWIAYKYTA